MVTEDNAMSLTLMQNAIMRDVQDLKKKYVGKCSVSLEIDCRAGHQRSKEATASQQQRRNTANVLDAVCSNPLDRSQLKTTTSVPIRFPFLLALTASADVPSSVTETTDTTSTLPPPLHPLQKPTGSFKDGDGDGDSHLQFQ
ncbi:hypothetical protein Tco_0571265 [Tanacetum coccineum]